MKTLRAADLTRLIHALSDCRPGDTLIASKKQPWTSPILCKAPGISCDHPTSVELTLCGLKHEARCLVIRGGGDGWAYVLVDGQLGWISHTSVDRLEKLGSDERQA